MDECQAIYENVGNTMDSASSPIDRCGIYKSMSPDTLLNHGEESEYQQTTDACSYFRMNDDHLEKCSLRVEHSLKLLKILLVVLGLLMILGLIVTILGVALASASWSNVLNQSLHVNPSIEQSIANLSTLLHNEISGLRDQVDTLEQRLNQVSKIYENCHVDVANCSIDLAFRAVKLTCSTQPLLPINKKVCATMTFINYK